MSEKDFSDLGLDGGAIVPFESGRPARRPTIPHRTDLGNARRMVRYFGSELRYCPGLGWLVWTGRCWLPDQDGAVLRRAMQLPRLIRKEENIGGDDGLDAHARKSESRRSLESTVRLAQVQQELVLELEQLDRHPHLLNVANGTLDLRTLDLRPHRREDLLTQCAQVEFDADAQSARLRRFLADLTGGDAELGAFLQRVAGYCLWGTRPEKAFFVLLGPPDTGKTTLLEALLEVLGSYAIAGDFQTFLASRHGAAGARPDVAALRGRRLVVAAEVESGARFDGALLKRLTGGDTVAARHLYREAIEFRPIAAIFLAANDMPRVAPDDDALWGRLVVVPCAHAVSAERMDPTLGPALRDPRADAPALLAWAARGCLEWQRRGLDPPACVSASRAELRLRSHPLADFFDSQCIMDPAATTPVAELFDAYRRFTHSQGDGPPKARSAFGRLLASAGLQSVLGSSAEAVRRRWKGIRLRQAPDRTDRTAHDSEDRG